ncbi:MAG: DUF5690 family protein [Polyangiales bacterium]
MSESEKRRFPASTDARGFVVYAGVLAFAAYFSMYAFRKPFAAGLYEGSLFGVEEKTAFVVAQIAGYTLSKFIGVRVLSALAASRLRFTLLFTVFVAWLALLAFAVLPPAGAALALFFNGLPLGLVWGLVVRYLEGRRQSEALLAGMSASFIVASGAVKDIGRELLAQGVSEEWMPALVGALFLPLYVGAVFLIDRLPPPSELDISLRNERRAMTRQERGDFLRRYAGSLIPLFAIYFCLTAYRDFRDNYGVEIFEALGYQEAALFTQSELPVAVLVLVVLGALYRVRDRRRGLIAVYAVMMLGMLVLILSPVLRGSGLISGMTWMVLTGVGSYFAYVPFGAMLFERLVAISGGAGTAVFAIYIADALGYTGSIALQLGRDLIAPDVTRLVFFEGFTLALGVGALLLFAVSLCVLLRTRRTS